MRVERVTTNETCNQNCWFCNARRPAERPEVVARLAVQRRIAAAHAVGAKEVVLTGGEPTLRSDIADLIERAAHGGARAVLETNGALIDATRAQQFAAAGLAIARVQLVAWGDEADEITREPGGFAAALCGIRALAAAGVTVEITIPVVRRNVGRLAALAREIAAAQLPVRALLLVIVTTAPDPADCLSLREAADEVTAVAEAARGVGLTVQLAPQSFLSPCVFEKPERVTHLFALNRGHAARPGFVRVAACVECLVSDRCPGLPADASGPAPIVRPIRDDRVRRRLTVASSVEEQIAREFIGVDQLRSATDELVPEYTVRVNFHCNQSCEFCFVSTHLPRPAESAVREAIATAGRARAVLVLSGGEPTLNANLVEYVQLAKQCGVRAVELQTNAIRLADPALTQALAAAGLDRAMVSLHGASADVSDAVTGAPGTFASTLRGIDELARSSVHVRLNFVFCQANRGEFPHLVELAAQRWPNVGVVVSFVGSHTDVVPRTTALIPSFTDIIPSLVAGLAIARSAGVPVYGFDSMCGLPLCLVPESERAGFSSIPVAADGGQGEFVKAEVCGRCAENHRCYGMRRGYAELYGTRELHALT